MEDDEKAEQAISLKEAARRLGLSYQTVWAKRHHIAFRLPGSRVWRVWPSQLAEVTKPIPKGPLPRLTGFLPPDRVTVPMSLSARQAEKELDALLARRNKKRL